jgi:hypothetical protein
MGRHSAAHYFLEGLVDLGVEYIFANLGTDHVSLIEEIARWDREGRKHPEVILCPHEIATHWRPARARRCSCMSMPELPMPAWPFRTCFVIGCR